MKAYLYLLGLMFLLSCNDDDSIFSGEGRISGLVTFMNPKTTIEADTAKGAEITLVQFDENLDTLTLTSLTFVTNNGTYDLPFLDVGVYSLEFTFEQGGVTYSETVEDIQIMDESDDDISPVLMPSNGNFNFQGTVTVDDLLTRALNSQGAAFATVNLIDPESEEIAYSTMSSDDGEFAMDSIKAGDYTLEIIYQSEITYYFSTSLSIVNDLTNVDYQVTRIANSTLLRILTNDSDGIPLSNVTVCLYINPSIFQNRPFPCAGSIVSKTSNSEGIVLFPNLTDSLWVEGSFNYTSEVAVSDSVLVHMLPEGQITLETLLIE
ncbi:MAG: hypothetical protein AAGF85_03875 [Bacteroidota bacterium]